MNKKKVSIREEEGQNIEKKNDTRLHGYYGCYSNDRFLQSSFKNTHEK